MVPDQPILQEMIFEKNPIEEEKSKIESEETFQHDLKS